RWQGAVQVLRGPAALPARTAGLLLAVHGRWTVAPLSAAPGEALVLAPNAGLWWADEAPGWRATPQPGAGSGARRPVSRAPAGRPTAPEMGARSPQGKNMHKNGLQRLSSKR